jgi:DNA-directed RNA polymerase specialized sigma24 family protein
VTRVDLDVHLPAIAAGDAAAFGQWMAAAERPLRQSLRSFARRVDVEAVLQEALLRAWNVAPRLERDGRPNALLRLTLRAARNLAIDETRRTRGAQMTGAAGGDDGEAGGDEAAVALAVTEAGRPDPWLRAAIATCHEGLPARPQQALATRLESRGSEPDETLAARLGMRLNAFLQNFTRARKLLAECLRAHGIDLKDFA